MYIHFLNIYFFKMKSIEEAVKNNQKDKITTIPELQYAIQYTLNNTYPIGMLEYLLDEFINRPLSDIKNREWIIIWASSSGYTKLVELLLKEPKINPTIEDNTPIRVATINGYLDIVNLFIADERADPAKGIPFAEAGPMLNNLVDALLKKVSPQSINTVLQWSATNGYSDLLALILRRPNTDPSVSDNAPIRFAVKNGHTNTVILLLASGRVDPSANNNEAIIWASYYGYTDIVRLLLNDPSVDPTADNNKSIQVASQYGHEEIVRLLLANPRTDPSRGYDNALKFGHDKIVELLLQSEHTFQYDIHELISFGIDTGNIYITDLIYANGIDLSYDSNYFIRYASLYGNYDIVDFLLQQSTVNPADENNFAIRMASGGGHLNIVTLLTSDSRVNVQASDNESLRRAASNGHFTVVQYLLQQVFVDPTAGNNEALRKRGSKRLS